MGRIEINKEKCKGCQLCTQFCPKKLIIMEKTFNKRGYRPAVFIEEGLEKDLQCTGCAMCATICPDVAIEVWR